MSYMYIFLVHITHPISHVLCCDMLSVKGLVINYGEGGYRTGKSRVQNFLRPPPTPQDRIQLVVPPPPPPQLLKNGNSLYHIKTTPKLVVSPPSFSMTKNNSAPLFVGVKLHMPLLLFCSPPTPPPPPPRN